MLDDREEFEQGQIAKDDEAYHREGLEDLAPDFSGGVMANGSRVGEQTAPSTAGASEMPLDASPRKPVFGERLRAEANTHHAGKPYDRLCGIADAIDRDAKNLVQEFGGEIQAGLGDVVAALTSEFEEAKAALRRNIEDLMEELRYTDYFDRREGTGEKDVLEVEPFLERLGGIFGEPAEGTNRPRVICLCGSTRFIELFAIKTWELEREGFIVLGCTLLPASYCSVPDHFGEATGTKEQCDELHLRKIDLADEILVLNVNGYIGESTSREIAYAYIIGRPVKYLEPLIEPEPEHEPSHERRERKSARHEDSSGRVEGVDR